MSVILYKKTETGIESIMCDPHNLQNHRDAGWFLDSGGEHDGMPENEERQEKHVEKQDYEEEQKEEGQQQEFEKENTVLDFVDEMPDEELRDASRIAGFENWENARFSTLRKQLKEYKYIGECFVCSKAISKDSESKLIQEITGRLFCCKECYEDYLKSEGF